MSLSKKQINRNIEKNTDPRGYAKSIHKARTKALNKARGGGGKFGHDMDKRKAKLDYDEFIVE